MKRLLRTSGILVLLGGLGLFILTTSKPSEVVSTAVLPAPIETTVTLDDYGLAADAFDVEEREIRRSQTFSEILSEFDIPAETINEIVERARPTFDVRRIRAGVNYRVYQSDSTAHYLVYEQDPINYYVFNLNDSLGVRAGQRPVRTEQKVISGTINSSLFQTLEEELGNVEVGGMVAMALSKVFAWQVDFFRLQKGDNFHLVFEQQFVDDQPVGIGDVKAARFQNAGKEFYAFRFEQADGTAGYYDENGNSLQKAFLMAPLKLYRITSNYSKRRFHPVQKRYKAHLGTDYAAPTGTPIHATGSGVVLEAGYSSGNGNYVKIRHNGTYTTGYLHMSRIAKGIRPGVRVEQDQVIGYVGSTGLATGPHVCYRFWKNGVQVDSRKEVLPDSEPLTAEQQPAFDSLRTEFLPLLHDIPRQYAYGPIDFDALRSM